MGDSPEKLGPAELRPGAHSGPHDRPDPIGSSSHSLPTAPRRSPRPPREDVAAGAMATISASAAAATDFSKWDELRREARKLEGDLDVRLSAYAKLGGVPNHLM